MKQEPRTLTLAQRPFHHTFSFTPCTYKASLDAWVVSNVDLQGVKRPVFIVHCDYKYHMVESGMEWNPSHAWHIPDTGKHSFRMALARALGMEAYPGDWYLASRTYDDAGDSYSKLYDERQRHRNEQEILDDFIRDIREVDGSSTL